MIIKKKGSRFFLVYLILPALLFSSPGLVPGAAAKTINFSASSDTASFLGGLSAADWFTSEKPVVGDMMGTNLIPNAQMESTSYWGGGPTRALIEGPFGNVVYAHESVESGTACYAWAQTARIPVDQNKTYKFSIWIKALTADESNYFGYHTYNAAGTQLSSNPYFWSGSTANEWTLYEAILGPSYSTNCNTALTNGTDFCMESGTASVIMRFGSCYGNGNNTGKTYYAYPVIQEINPESLGTSGNYYVGGNVGIGKVTPAAKLDLSGTFRSTSLAGSGNVTVMADNAGTLYTANTWLQNGTSVYKSSGNVGIGTNSPVKKLEVTGSTPSLYVWANDSGTSDFFVGENSSGGYGLNINWDSSYTYTMNARYAGTNTSIYQVDTRNNYSVFSTNVGIGSATPGQKLDVNGYTKATGFCIGTNCITSWPTAGADTVIGNEVTNATNATLARSGSGTAAAPYTLGLNLGNANTWTAAQTFSGGASFPSGIWNTSGYVGIGTTGPAERVNIVGGHSDTRLRLSAFTGVASPNDSAFLSLWASEPGVTYTGAGIGNNINGNTNYGRIATTRGASYIRLLDNGLAFNTISSAGTDTNVMYINGVNVGIGSTGPSAKLYVNGSFRSSSALVSGLAGAGTVLVMSDNSGNLYSGASGTSGQTLRHNGTSWVSNSALYNNGTNVGVGPTSPGQKLDVGTATSHYIRSYGGFVGNAAANIGGTGAAAYFPSGAYIAGSSSWIYGGVSFNGILKDNQATPRWQINPAGNSWFYGGNLGIGTTVTYAKLEVNGATAFDASNPSTATYGLHFTGPATAGYGSGITWGGYNSTEAQAGIYVKSDSNSTSMYFGTTESYDPGAQTRMIIDSAGNVGIGTTGPAKLFVSGALYSGSASIYGLAGSGNVMVMADNNGGLYTAAPAAVNGWTVNGGNVFTSGNVGIGTTSAGQKLDVNGYTKATGFCIGASCITSWPTAGADTVIGNEVTNATNATLARSGSGTAAAPYTLALNLGNANTWTAAQTFSGGASFPSGIWNTSGNVGIGTTSAGQKLDVNGYTKATGFCIGTSCITSWPTAGADTVIGNEVTNATNATLARSGSGTAAAPYTLALNLGNANTWTAAQTFSGGASFPSGIWNTSGNVGIGTTNPTAKLHVVGTTGLISTGSTQLSSLGGAGAVFVMADNSGNLYTATESGRYLTAKTETSAIDVNALGDNFLLYGGSTSLWLNRGPSGHNGGAILHIPTHSGGYYSDLWFDTANNRLYSRAVNATSIGSWTLYPKVSTATANYLSKWASPDALANSVIYDNGTNVGIGTTNPGRRLQIDANTSGPALRLTNTNSNGGIEILPGASYYSWRLGVQNRIDGIDFTRSSVVGGTTFDQTMMVLTNNGNVGVGTTAPAAKLNINETTGTVHGPSQGSLIIDHANGTGASSVVFRSAVNRGSDYGFIQYQDAATVGAAGESARLIIGTSNDADDHLVLLPTGNVGVGTNAPGQKLHVVGNSYATGNGMFAGLAFHGGSGITTNGLDRLNLVAGSYTYIPYGVFYVGGRSHFRGGIDNDQDTYLTVAGGTSGVTYFSGAVGIGNTAPSYTLDVSGSMRATGDIYANAFLYNSSDRRLKENIKPLTRSLSKIQALEGVSFDWKKTGRSSLGLIAQDVELIYPELVSVDKEGYKAIAYEGLIAPLIEAVKAQQLEIENLEARLEKLEARVGQ